MNTGPLFTAQPAGRRRRFPRPWGIGLVATDPDAFARGTRRMRLTHAAAVTSAMALAWTLPTANSPMAQRSDLRPAPSAEAALKKRVDDIVESAPRASRATAGQVTTPVAPARLDTEAAEWSAAVVAEMGEIEIFEPSQDLAVVGFHEATYGTALPLTPADPPKADHGREPVQHGERGEDLVGTSMILPTRARGTHPASAIDLAIPEGSLVHAPITGTVTAVDPYALYGRHDDYRIEITPAGHPEIMVIVLHVTDPLVAVGDEVVGGVTPFAESPTAFPFESQIDRFTEAEHGQALPHVHVEMRMR